MNFLRDSSSPGSNSVDSDDQIQLGHFLLLVAALALGFHARISGLAGESLWLDEAYTLYWAKQPIADILAQPQAESRLFTLLQKAAVAVMGDRDITVRVVPLVASLLTTVFVYKASRLLSGSAAWVAAALFLVYPVAISWGRIGRANSLLLLAASVFLWLSLRFLRQPRRETLAWALVTWLAVLYAHRSGYFLAPLLFVLLALRRDFLREQSRFVGWALLAAALASFPLALVELAAASFTQPIFGNVARLAPEGIAPWLYPLYSLYNLTPQTVHGQRSAFELLGVGPQWVPVAHLLYLLPACAGLAAWRQSELPEGPSAEFKFIVLWALTPTVVMAGLSLCGLSVYIAGRYDLPLLLPMVLVPVHGLSLLQAPRVRWVLWAGIALSLLPYHVAIASGARPTFRGFDRSTAMLVSRAMTANDTCVFVEHIYWSYARYFQPEKLGQCTSVNVSSLNVASETSTALETFLPPRMTAGAHIWVLAPLDSFAREGELGRVRSLIADLAGQHGLRAAESTKEVLFDFQGTAKVIRYSLSAGGSNAGLDAAGSAAELPIRFPAEFRATPPSR